MQRMHVRKTDITNKDEIRGEGRKEIKNVNKFTDRMKVLYSVRRRLSFWAG
jgi:hypothetical protein